MLEPNTPEIVATCSFIPQAVSTNETYTPPADCPEAMARDPSTVLAMRVWPHPAWAWWRPGQRRWFPGSLGTPGAVLADPHEAHIDDHELDGWDIDVRTLMLAIPPEIRAAIRPLPKFYAWKALILLAAVPEALDLVRENPVLSGLLAIDQRRVFADEPFHSTTVRTDLLDALRRPRRSLLPLLGLPNAKWILRALERMPPEVLIGPMEEDLLDLLRSTDKEVQRRLQHLPHLPADVVAVLADEKIRRLASYGLLADPTPRGLDELVERLTRLDEAGVTRRFRSWAELEAASEELPAAIRGSDDEPWDLAEFPGEFNVPTGRVVVQEREPRIVVTPITNAAEMAAHGVIQENCVVGMDFYPEFASYGLGAMYSCLWRRDGLLATLWLRPEEDGRWLIAELAGPRNAPVPPGITRRLEEWVGSLETVEDVAGDASGTA